MYRNDYQRNHYQHQPYREEIIYTNYQPDIYYPHYRDSISLNSNVISSIVRFFSKKIFTDWFLNITRFKNLLKYIVKNDNNKYEIVKTITDIIDKKDNHIKNKVRFIYKKVLPQKKIREILEKNNYMMVNSLNNINDIKNVFYKYLDRKIRKHIDNNNWNSSSDSDIFSSNSDIFSSDSDI